MRRPEERSWQVSGSQSVSQSVSTTLTPDPNPNPSNMGSAKLLSFGVLAGLSKEETLALFG